VPRSFASSCTRARRFFGRDSIGCVVYSGGNTLACPSVSNRRLTVPGSPRTSFQRRPGAGTSVFE
jgi:hypothetical protein